MQMVADPNKIEFQRLRLQQALAYLTNLCISEYYGTTLPVVGIHIGVPKDIKDPSNWLQVHRTTLKSLLFVIFA
jgi:hypothetical protein